MRSTGRAFCCRSLGMKVRTEQMDLTAKQEKWLRFIAGASKIGDRALYAGAHADFIPAKVRRALQDARLIESEFPHNPVHKERVVITDIGREALARGSKNGSIETRSVTSNLLSWD